MYFIGYILAFACYNAILWSQKDTVSKSYKKLVINSKKYTELEFIGGLLLFGLGLSLFSWLFVVTFVVKELIRPSIFK